MVWQACSKLLCFVTGYVALLSTGSLYFFFSLGNWEVSRCRLQSDIMFAEGKGAYVLVSLPGGGEQLAFSSVDGMMDDIAAAQQWAAKLSGSVEVPCARNHQGCCAAGVLAGAAAIKGINFGWAPRARTHTPCNPMRPTVARQRKDATGAKEAAPTPH